jgi:predicted ATP-binding protein involved in virulence
MKLKKLEITNFRCFESLSIDFDEQLTVLVAKNGHGKSSVLDAIRIGLWSFVSGFDLARNSQNDPANGIRIDDVRMLKIRDGQMARQLPCNISLEGDLHSWDVDRHWDSWALQLLSLDSRNTFKISKWTRYRESEAKGTKTKDDAGALLIKNFVSFLQDKVRSPDSPEIDLLIFGYYGTGRLWSQKRLTEDKKAKTGKQNADFYMRLFAYRDCLDPASSYKHFVDWFTWIFECYREQQINEQEKGVSEGKSVWQDSIQVVQEAINTLLQETGWHSLEYSVSYGKTLIMKHNDQGILRVDQLSDGIRGVLAMVGDIAYRCIKLNPHLGLNAAKETCGVVMIDEVDMHLHPAWQQTILVDLIKAFPKIQFIVTTHSPQVLTTVKSKCIRLLFADYNGLMSSNIGSEVAKIESKALTPSINTYGEESKIVLEDLMHVNSRPHTDESDLLQRYLQRINQGHIDSLEVTQWRQTLEQVFGSEYSKLKLADMVISKWKAKRGLA